MRKDSTLLKKSSLHAKCLLVLRHLLPPPFDLSGKALYLRPYEYWSPLIYTMKNLGMTTISPCTEHSMFCNKTLSIKPVNHRNPSCKDTQIFPTLTFALTTYKLCFDQRWGPLCHQARAHHSFFYGALYFPFLSINLYCCFVICVSCPVLCLRVART
jgi:hypothetical protein